MHTLHTRPPLPVECSLSPSSQDPARVFLSLARQVLRAAPTSVFLLHGGGLVTGNCLLHCPIQQPLAACGWLSCARMKGNFQIQLVVSVGWSCRIKVPDTRGLNPQAFILPQFGRRKSEIKLPAGLVPSEATGADLFLILVFAGNRWCSLAC